MAKKKGHNQALKSTPMILLYLIIRTCDQTSRHGASFIQQQREIKASEIDDLSPQYTAEQGKEEEEEEAKEKEKKWPSLRAHSGGKIKEVEREGGRAQIRRSWELGSAEYTENTQNHQHKVFQIDGSRHPRVQNMWLNASMGKTAVMPCYIYQKHQHHVHTEEREKHAPKHTPLFVLSKEVYCCCLIFSTKYLLEYFNNPEQMSLNWNDSFITITWLLCNSKGIGIILW